MKRKAAPFSYHHESCRLEHQGFQHGFYAFSNMGQIRAWLGITKAMSTTSSTLKWIKNEGRRTTWQSKARRVALANTIYHIWIACNR